MDLEPQAVTSDKRDANRAIAGFVIDTIARGPARWVRRALGGLPDLSPPADSKTRTRFALPNLYLLSFIIFVTIPAFVCVFYLVFIASNEYVSEARFAVHTLQIGLSPSSSSGQSNDDSHVASAGGPFAGSAPTITNQNAYIIANYISSRTIIDDLKDKIDIRAIFQRPEADFWARLGPNASAEDLLHYWRNAVSAYVDATSAIVIVTVRTFRPADSVALAQAILSASEKLANDVSARARREVMHDAEAEVRRSEGLVQESLLEMRKFRDAQGFIDPLSAANSTSTLLLETMSQKIQAENDYFVAAKAMSPNAPSVTSLKTRLDALDAQIAQLQSQLTSKSPEGRTISASLTKFEGLELKRMFAEKLYTMAQDALERARLKAEEQNIYIEPFVQPDIPEESEYPHRFSLSLIIPFAIFMIWATLAMLASSIEDHKS